jgi:hypothetical protein
MNVDIAKMRSILKSDELRLIDKFTNPIVREFFTYVKFYGLQPARVSGLFGIAYVTYTNWMYGLCDVSMNGLKEMENLLEIWRKEPPDGVLATKLGDDILEELKDHITKCNYLRSYVAAGLSVTYPVFTRYLNGPASAPQQFLRRVQMYLENWKKNGCTINTSWVNRSSTSPHVHDARAVTESNAMDVDSPAPSPSISTNSVDDASKSPSVSTSKRPRVEDDEPENKSNDNDADIDTDDDNAQPAPDPSEHTKKKLCTSTKPVELTELDLKGQLKDRIIHLIDARHLVWKTKEQVKPLDQKTAKPIIKTKLWEFDFSANKNLYLHFIHVSSAISCVDVILHAAANPESVRKSYSKLPLVNQDKDHRLWFGTGFNIRNTTQLRVFVKVLEKLDHPCDYMFHETVSFYRFYQIDLQTMMLYSALVSGLVDLDK